MSDPLAWLHQAAADAPVERPTRGPVRRNENTERTSTGHPMAWADDGACAGMDPDLFHPVDGGGDLVDPDVVAACGRCPVRAECLDWALRHEPVGYWGGQTEKGRRRMRRALAIPDPPRSAPTPSTTSWSASPPPVRARGRAPIIP